MISGLVGFRIGGTGGRVGFVVWVEGEEPLEPDTFAVLFSFGLLETDVVP
jgi:hypothetical protein